MFGRESLKKQIRRLERRLFVAMCDDCRQNKHAFFIVNERLASDYCGGQIECYHVRALECSRCGYRTGDSNRLGGWQHVTITGSFVGAAKN